MIKGDEIRCCGMCGDVVEERHSGDEGWTICDGCGTVEGPTKDRYWCESCQGISDNEYCSCDEESKTTPDGL